MTDIEIAQAAMKLPIKEVAAAVGIEEEDLELYGKYKAKLSEECLEKLQDRPDGKLVLVTAINPTPAGEGKTTISIGLADALNRIGRKAAQGISGTGRETAVPACETMDIGCADAAAASRRKSGTSGAAFHAVLALREPSLGPCFGVKGGAAGGGYAQVVPMEDLNLHFTGDFHAITAANNLLAAALDNHLHFGNALRIDPTRVVWKRCMDMNDRALRNITVGMGGKINGPVREDHFVITAASEVMAVVCLADDMEDLRARLSRMVVAYDYDGNPVLAGQLNVVGAMLALLKDALLPNLLQTLEHTPALVHGGPFANIAHGCNSVRATKAALKLGDIVVTEAGFGADLGAEKFLDIKCREAGLKPDAAVIVATVQALKYNGGVPKAQLKEENVEALKKGIVNLGKHIENLQKFGVPAVVAINNFITDTDAELQVIEDYCREHGTGFALAQVWAKGGEGGIDLAKKVLSILNRAGDEFQADGAGTGAAELSAPSVSGTQETPAFKPDSQIHPLYALDQPLTAKIETVAKEIYGADGVEYTQAAKKALANLEKFGYGNLPVCIAKTQYSLSDDQHLLGRPHGFTITVRDAYVSAGAGFVVVLTGEIIQMPGLPRVPAAEGIDIAEDGQITGLF